MPSGRRRGRRPCPRRTSRTAPARAPARAPPGRGCPSRRPRARPRARRGRCPGAGPGGRRPCRPGRRASTAAHRPGSARQQPGEPRRPRRVRHGRPACGGHGVVPAARARSRPPRFARRARTGAGGRAACRGRGRWRARSGRPGPGRPSRRGAATSRPGVATSRAAVAAGMARREPHAGRGGRAGERPLQCERGVRRRLGEDLLEREPLPADVDPPDAAQRPARTLGHHDVPAPAERLPGTPDEIHSRTVWPPRRPRDRVCPRAPGPGR